MKRKRPEQQEFDVDPGKSTFPHTGLGEGKRAVRTGEMELIRDRDLAEEDKTQQDLFGKGRRISLSTIHCLRKDSGKGNG